MGRVGQAIRNLWNDVRSSTDASLLGAARFLGLLYGPIDRRLRIDQAFRKSMGYRLPSFIGWRHALGGITYLLFVVLVITGVLLAFYYRPSAQEAYPSVQHIVSRVSFGWLVRDLHVWSASLIVVVMLAHMARVFFNAAYKPPRETNWLVGILLLGVVLAFGATGYLLPWDQWAYWTVTEVVTALETLPVVGGLLVQALIGDELISGATLSRFFAWHVIILPWIAFALLAYHFTLIRRRGIAPPGGKEVERGTGVPFFPNHLLRSFMVVLLVLGVTLTVVLLFPRPIGEPANPYELPTELVSTWVPVDVSLGLIRYLGIWGFVLFSALGLSMALVPLFDRHPEYSLRRRPVVAALGLTFFGGFVIAWIAGWQLRSLPPSESLLREVSEERVLPTSRRVPVPEVEPLSGADADSASGVSP
jgi:quinol-cytochrome oxidoreductase complex cytochrome b subunit